MSYGVNPDVWFNCRKADPRAKLRLFCLPYAGGGASIYRGWEHYLPAGVDVWPVQLPGRGSRFNEAPYDSMDLLVGDAAEALGRRLDLPFSIFGHSFGAMVGFELAHRLREQFGVTPRHLFVSGCRGPHLPRCDSQIHQLPDEQFIEGLVALNGTPREVLENSDLMRTMLGALRGDFKLAETYGCSGKPPLNCPITALGGSEDDSVPQEELEAWRSQTNGLFNLWMLPGDHFFIHTSDTMLRQILTQEFRRLLN
jgi:medium-chain acyl-[acyl-carrier-protein] hydrolase